MKNKKRFVPWLIAAVIIAAFAVIGKKLYDLMFGGSLAVTTEDLKNGIIACSPAIIFIVVVLIAALIVVVAAGKLKQPKRALVRAQAPPVRSTPEGVRLQSRYNVPLSQQHL